MVKKVGKQFQLVFSFETIDPKLLSRNRQEKAEFLGRIGVGRPGSYEEIGKKRKNYAKALENESRKKQEIISKNGAPGFNES